MWNPTDFSCRKFKRKWEADGLSEAIIAAGELATRKQLAIPILQTLIQSDLINTLDRSDLFCISDQVYMSSSESINCKPNNICGGSEFIADIADGGYVLPNTGLGTDIDGHIIRETVGSPRKENRAVIEAVVWHAFNDSPHLANALLQGKTSSFDSYAKSLDIACPLSPRYINYYHWMIQTVPKLRYIREYESTADLDVTYLVPPAAPSWLNETLDLLGVPEKKVERATAPIYFINRLLIPSFPQSKLRNYRWLREAILAGVTLDQGAIDTGGNIYISRDSAVERRVVNEKQVVNLLSNFGFKSYQLEQQTVAENVALFNEADMIVSPHGAGLTDILFCNDATVTELFGSKVQNAYKKLSDVMEIEYQAVHCEPRSTDIYVNTAQLQNIIT